MCYVSECCASNSVSTVQIVQDAGMLFSFKQLVESIRPHNIAQARSWNCLSLMLGKRCFTSRLVVAHVTHDTDQTTTCPFSCHPWDTRHAVNLPRVCSQMQCGLNCSGVFPVSYDTEKITPNAHTHIHKCTQTHSGTRYCNMHTNRVDIFLSVLWILTNAFISGHYFLSAVFPSCLILIMKEFFFVIVCISFIFLW